MPIWHDSKQNWSRHKRLLPSFKARRIFRFAICGEPNPSKLAMIMAQLGFNLLQMKRYKKKTMEEREFNLKIHNSQIHR